MKYEERLRNEIAQPQGEIKNQTKLCEICKESKIDNFDIVLTYFEDQSLN